MRWLRLLCGVRRRFVRFRWVCRLCGMRRRLTLRLWAPRLLFRGLRWVIVLLRVRNPFGRWIICRVCSRFRLRLNISVFRLGLVRCKVRLLVFRLCRCRWLWCRSVCSSLGVGVICCRWCRTRLLLLRWWCGWWWFW